MNVSNSTGQNTDYRVASGGGMGMARAIPKSGKIAPGKVHSVDVTRGQRCEFLVDGQVVAFFDVDDPDIHVELFRNGNGYEVRPV